MEVAVVAGDPESESQVHDPAESFPRTSQQAASLLLINNRRLGEHVIGGETHGFPCGFPPGIAGNFGADVGVIFGGPEEARVRRGVREVPQNFGLVDRLREQVARKRKQEGDNQ